MALRVALREYLDRNNLTAYRLVQATKGRVAERTVYGLARGDVKRVDLETLNEVMAALEGMTGQPVTPNDLLDFAPNPVPTGTEQAEEDAQLDASAGDLAEALDELERDVPPEERRAWLEAFDRAAE